MEHSLAEKYSRGPSRLESSCSRCYLTSSYEKSISRSANCRGFLRRRISWCHSINFISLPRICGAIYCLYWRFDSGHTCVCLSLETGYTSKSYYLGWGSRSSIPRVHDICPSRILWRSCTRGSIMDGRRSCRS